MKSYTRAELDVLLAATQSRPARPAVPGWEGYSLVVSSCAYADTAWRVESAAAIPSKASHTCSHRAQDAAAKLARQLGLAVPTPIPGNIAFDGNAKWWIAQALVPDADGTPRVCATALPDLVLAAHFPAIRGPLVAVVCWPPGANNDRSRCVVKAVCLGADAWAHLDAAQRAFRERTMGISRECDHGRLVIKVETSGSATCETGALMRLSATDVYSIDETWSAEVVADLRADDPLRALVFASKQ